MKELNEIEVEPAKIDIKMSNLFYQKNSMKFIKNLRKKKKNALWRSIIDNIIVFPDGNITVNFLI